MGESGPPSARVHYSGVVVTVRPERMETCAQDLDDLSGVEVHHRHPDSGRLVVVVECRTIDEQQQALQRIQAVPGVLVAAPVYHYVDETAED